MEVDLGRKGEDKPRGKRGSKNKQEDDLQGQEFGTSAEMEVPAWVAWI